MRASTALRWVSQAAISVVIFSGLSRRPIQALPVHDADLRFAMLSQLPCLGV